jgi:hypothetical protein
MNKPFTILAARWKATVPLVVYGLSEALKHNTELNTPSGKLAFASAVLAAIAVHQVPNKETAVVVDPAKPVIEKVKDAGQVSLRLLLMILAIVCLVIFTLAAHGSITTDEGFTWLGAGLVFWAVAEVVP